jgi:hypothetical protein
MDKPNVANNRCKWSAAEFASVLIWLVSVHPETLVFEAPELLVKEYFS